MKKYIIMAAAAFMAFAGCTKDKFVPSHDGVSIAVAPDRYTFAPAGGTFDAIVSSKGDWTVEVAENSTNLISVDKTAGHDGEIVTFTAQENTGNADLSAEFVFKADGKTATFVAILKTAASAPKTIVLDSAAEYEIGFAERKLDVELTTNLNYRAVEYTLSDGAEAWITYNVTVCRETGKATMNFTVAKNETKALRQGTITITGEGVTTPAVVSIKQRPEAIIAPEDVMFVIPLEGGSVAFDVDATVEYSVAIDTEGATWLTHGEKDQDGKETFSAEANATKRSATVTFTEKSPLPGVEAVTATVTIMQDKLALISKVADMTDLRGKAQWDYSGTYGKFQSISKFTYEALVYANEFTHNISTVMGIEGEALLRLGDDSSRKSQIQAAGTAGTITAPSNYDLQAKKWYHLALVYDTGLAILYLDGVEVQRGYIANTSWASKDLTYSFYVGYSYEGGREFSGYMSELRIWTKALTVAEINAKDHFYTVDPSSEGLEVYWKMDDGKDKVFHDYTGHGNDLKCQGLVAGSWDECDAKIVSVNLPEE